MPRVLFFAMVLACAAYVADGHGMVMDPVNRASRWRKDPSAPVNWNDNELFCGGLAVQWGQNGGKCGLCGDNFVDPTPRTHELGGPYGQGTIVESYTPGSELLVQVMVTSNHLGFFSFHMCNMDKFSEESEECFADTPLLLTNGESKYVIDSRYGYFDVPLRLPEGLVCEHCILQWTWTTGNSWGECDSRAGGPGCGEEQETFRTCSDISVLPESSAEQASIII